MYKRQLIDQSGQVNVLLGFLGYGFVFLHLKVAVDGKAGTGGDEPVSYTHLDVYKRQVRHGEGAHPSVRADKSFAFRHTDIDIPQRQGAAQGDARPGHRQALLFRDR